MTFAIAVLLDRVKGKLVCSVLIVLVWILPCGVDLHEGLQAGVDLHEGLQAGRTLLSLAGLGHK